MGITSNDGTTILGSLLRNEEMTTPEVEAHASTSCDSPPAKVAKKGTYILNKFIIFTKHCLLFTV